jgi:hypothetical protein
MGSDSFDAVVALTFIVSIAVLTIRARTFAGALAKSLLAIFCLATVLSAAVYRFGNPLLVPLIGPS